MIDALQNERVTKFVEDVASNLPKYGLDKPQLQLTFSSFASRTRQKRKRARNRSPQLPSEKTKAITFTRA
jgi:hypothetical protein